MSKIIYAPKIIQRTISNSAPKGNNIKPTLNNKPDVIDIANKQTEKSSTVQDLFDLTMTTLGLVVGIRKLKELPPINSDMTLIDINAHFKDIFLNEDLSLGETKVMLDRYKELDKIEDDEEYVKALFKEAKANYGIPDNVSELKLVDEISKKPNYKTDGFTDPLCNITISMQGRTREQLFNTVHHELRHAKQHIYAFNYDPKTYLEYSQPKNIELPQEYFEYCLGCEPSIENIPSSKHNFAKKCVEGMKAYKSASTGIKNYAVQFVEKDAFSAGNRICEIMKII